MPKKPEIINTSTQFESRLFRVESVDLSFTNGEERCYERICGRLAVGSVMIVPLLDDDTLLLIREYCVGVDDYVLGFPKGAVEYGEELIHTANRELMEEVGYAARELTSLGRFSTSPGYMTSVMDVMLARDLYPQVEEGDEPEPIQVVKWPLSDIDTLLAQPDFHEARSIAALLLVERQYKKGQKHGG